MSPDVKSTQSLGHHRVTWATAGASHGEEPAALTPHPSSSKAEQHQLLLAGVTVPLQETQFAYFPFFFSSPKSIWLCSTCIANKFQPKSFPKNDILVFQPALLPSANTVF